VKRTAAVVVCFAAAALGACGWWNSPEREIRRVLDGIAERLSHDAPLTALAAAAAVAGLQEYLSEDVVIDAGAPVPPLVGRESALGAAARLLGGTPALLVQFVDVQVALAGESASGQGRAEVTCNVTADVTDRAGQTARDARELTMTMRRMDGRWVVERVKASTVLEPVS
jgi:hypothetical protein